MDVVSENWFVWDSREYVVDRNMRVVCMDERRGKCDVGVSTQHTHDT